MAGLISDQLLSNLRTVAYRQLTDSITVTRSTVVEGPYGGEREYATHMTTLAWVVPKFKADYVVQPGGLAGVPNAAEVRVQHGLDIVIGDRLVIKGEDWEVTDTNDEASITLYLKLWAKRVQ